MVLDQQKWSTGAKHLVQDPSKVQHSTYGTILPNEIRGIQIHETFKKSIKTYLFKSVYDLN